MERYDPATGRWTAVPAPPQFSWRIHTSAASGATFSVGSLTALPDGTLLVMGSAAEVYDPITGSWTTAASPLASPDGRYPGDATPLLDGTVLFTGVDSDAQLYVPAGVPRPTGLAPIPNPTPTPIPTPGPTPFPPAAGPVPQGARPWEVTVENRSPKAATLFLAQEPLNDMGQLCGSVTPDVVPAHTTEKVLFQLPPKGVTECWLMIWPGPGADGQFGPTDDWPIPGHLIVGWPSENGDNLATVWAGP
jgi:hypothetical protein